MSGVVSTGFESKSIDEILEDMASAEKAELGADFLTVSASVGGQVNGIVANGLSELWEVAAVVQAGMSRDGAFGQQLDDLGALIGVSRQTAIYSSTTLRFTGTVAANVPINSQVSDPNDSTKKFRTTSAAVIGGGGFVDVAAVSLVQGRIYANAGTLTKMDTALPDITAVTNQADAIVGRNRETDAEYKSSQASSFGLTGSRTASAIKSAIKQITGVIYASVYVNATMNTVDGQPAKSVETIVEGGTDVAIRQVLHELVASGIETHGTTSGTVADDEGNVHTIKFSRPTQVDVYMQGTVEKSNLFSSPDAWKQMLIDFVDQLNPGQPVRIAKVIDTGFNATGVVDFTGVLLGRISGDLADLDDVNVTFSRREVARLQYANINVTFSDEP